MNWSDVLEEPTLQNIPFKIEMNEWGKIVLNIFQNFPKKLNFDSRFSAHYQDAVCLYSVDL